MGQTQKYSAIVHREGDWYVSLCPEIDIAGQGGKKQSPTSKKLSNSI